MYDGNFSLWCDFVEREFLDLEFGELLESGAVNGATSNPAIFKNAILNSPAYKAQKDAFSSKKPKELYEILATTDIRLAATKLLKNFVNFDDGFISIEVDPYLKTSDEIYKEGKRLYSTIGMPNTMIKIPAIKEGFEAMSELVARGISVNATLVFSLNQTKECLKAFRDGTKKFEKRFPKANLPKCVISVFVSRFDRKLDENLDEKFKGRVGIYNALKCYYEVESFGLENVRTLFASTGVKGDEYKKSYYIEELMVKNSINTAPLDTIKAFLADKKGVKTPPSKDEVDEFFALLEKSGVDIKSVSKELLKDGLEQFKVAFDEILSSLGK